MSLVCCTTTAYRKAASHRRWSITGFSHKQAISALVVCCSISVLAYLLQSNALATRGYHREQLEVQISHLREEHQSLELVIVQQRIPLAVQERVERYAFEPVDAISYMVKPDSVVAVK